MLNAYQIGFYPDTPLKGNPIYVPPKGFIEVTKDNEDTKVSPNFRIKEFLTKQKSGYPKYLVLDERLVFLLEAIGAHLEPLGWDAGDIFVMSGYRTPYYNKQLDDTKYSLHQWGRAADIFWTRMTTGGWTISTRTRSSRRKMRWRSPVSSKGSRRPPSSARSSAASGFTARPQPTGPLCTWIRVLAGPLVSRQLQDSSSSSLHRLP